MVEQERRSRLWIIGLVCGLMLASAGATWAVMTLAAPAEDPLETVDFTTVSVTEGEVGSSISLNAVARWDAEPVGVNRASGVVTSITDLQGQVVEAGDVLYTVNLRPVVIAQGETPPFRDLGKGARGDDVTQLQQLLTALEYFDGPADGQLGTDSVAAIRAWQKSLGVADTGVVEAGDVIFVPSLPLRVEIDDSVFVGATLDGGERLVLGFATQPEFRIPATEAQAARLTAGAPVQITSPEGQVWHAQIGSQSGSDDQGAINVLLTAAGDDGICGDQCDQVALEGQSPLPSQIITVEEKSGLIVPSAALATNSDGEMVVIGKDGEPLAVTVIVSAKGMSIIDGAPQGTLVRVPASGEAG